MSEYGGEGGKLRKADDFREDIERKGVEEVRKELALPDVDEILKDLQKEHGIRIGLSPKMLERVEKAKAEPRPADREAIGCQTQDICIICDTEDRCETCDTMDWCWHTDTHVVVE